MKPTTQLIASIAAAAVVAALGAEQPAPKRRAARTKRTKARFAQPLALANAVTVPKPMHPSLATAAQYKASFNPAAPAACPWCAARGTDSPSAGTEQQVLKRSGRQVVRAVFQNCSHSVTLKRGE